MSHGLAESTAPRGGLPVALDAMGGDRAPEETVRGAVRAVRELGIPVSLVGREQEIQRVLDDVGAARDGLTIVDAPDVVSMEDEAVAAIRRNARTSIGVAVEEVKQGRACALVSAGHSGAVVAASLLGLGRLPGVHRPGISITMPAVNGQTVLLIDAGAVTDPRPENLLQFAQLASNYLRHVSGIPSPRIGLLSNGEEAGKGNALIRRAYELLSAAPDINFRGNVEGNTIPSGEVDAVVADGFTGNVVLKTAEGVVSLLQATLRREMTANWRRKLLALGLRGAFRDAARRLDYREYGGAPLLGVAGVVIIAHGRSDSTAIRNAIAVAHRAGSRNTIDALAQGVAPTGVDTAGRS